MAATVKKRPLVVNVATHAQSARLLLAGQLAYMRDQGFDVALVCSPDTELDDLANREGVTVCPIKMNRELSPFRDLVALFRICRLFIYLRPQIVNAGTPKAGLLGMIAAMLARVPVRIYTLRGLRLETTVGWKRWLLRMTEKIAAASSHQVLCNSESLRQLYVKLGLADHDKTQVLGAGSGNGVEVKRFQFANHQLKQAQVIRSELGIAPNSHVTGFVGRLTKDKGVVELVDAFEQVKEKDQKAHLLLVGGYESGDPVPMKTVDAIKRNPDISLIGFVADTTIYYAIFDLLVIPSYREGFPNVVLEAAAAGLPVVGYRATGTVDAVQEGLTGRLVSIGTVKAFAAAILEFTGNPKLSRRYGEAGRHRVHQNFTREKVWQALADCYREHLKNSCCWQPDYSAVSKRQAA